MPTVLLSYLKSKKEIEAENARTLHVAMTPFRLVYQLFTIFGLAGMIICWFFINHIGWIVDVGPRSEWARQEVVDQLSKSISGGYNETRKMIDITVEFGSRSGGTYSYEGGFKDPWRQPDHFWVTRRTDYVADISYATGMDQPETSPTLLPFVLREHRASTQLLGFPYCHTGHPAIFATKPGPWGNNEDPHYLLDRKSGRMRRDFETAAIEVAALRSALAHLKAGQTLDSEYGPASGKPLEDSYCNADGADPIVLSTAQIDAYRAATYDIHLDDAPDVTFRYMYFGDEASQWNEAGMRIVGMCLDNGHDCDNDAGLMPYTTLYADLWAKDPPLSPTQLRAEQALLKTATWDFWKAEARANGINDTAPLTAEFEAAQRDLAAIFGVAVANKMTCGVMTGRHWVYCRRWQAILLRQRIDREPFGSSGNHCAWAKGPVKPAPSTDL
jgi:hypothetical protein